MYRPAIAAALLLTFGGACAPSTQATAFRQAAPKTSADRVEVFTDTKPDRTYEEVGAIQVTASELGETGYGELIERARIKAAEMGADAIVVTRDPKTRTTGFGYLSPQRKSGQLVTATSRTIRPRGSRWRLSPGKPWQSDGETAMRALIVDDEPLARRRLRTMLAGHADVEIVGEYADAVEAARGIPIQRPELVFLDVQMPGLDGFRLLESLGDARPPRVVFVTAHAQHAVRAFEVDAVDYLLKPYDEVRLARTLERARCLPAGAGSGAWADLGDLGVYQPLEKLGGGGMGVVYKARDSRLNRTVALKFLPAGAGDQKLLERRLLREANVEAALDHANVCAIHGVEKTPDGRPFLVMAYYDGETVKERVARGPLPVAEALDYVRQTVAGLAHAHAAGIVHRDVKPANLMVTRKGVVKILDFGIARTAMGTLTGPGDVLGTLAYMSPEQAAGEEVDHRTDLWAVGAVTYEMLAGTPPFGDVRDGLWYSLFHAIHFKEPAPIQSVRPDVPGDLAAIVHRLLEKVPERRFGDAGALMAALSAVGHATPPQARG